MRTFHRASTQQNLTPSPELEQIAPNSTATLEDPDSTFGSSSLPTLDELAPPESQESKRRRNIFRAVGVVVVAGAVTVAAILAGHRGSSEETTPNPTTPSTLALPGPGETTNPPNPNNSTDANKSPLDGKEVVWNFGNMKNYKTGLSSAEISQVKTEDQKEDDDVVLRKYARKHHLLYNEVPGTTQPAAFGECIVKNTGKVIDTSDNTTHTFSTITVNPIQFSEPDPAPGSKNKFVYTSATGVEDTGYQTSENDFYQVDESSNVIYPNYPNDLKIKVYKTADAQNVSVNVLGLFTKDPQLSKWKESGFVATNSGSGPMKMVVGGIVTVKDLPADQEKAACDYLVSISHS